MKKKVVTLILVDGFRHDYLNSVDAPFFYQLAQHNIDGLVRETFAFELRPAFFAGLQPEECGVAHMFYYNPKDSPFRAIDVRDSNRNRITQELKAEAERRGHSLVKFIGGCCEIPLPLLKYFDFSEKYCTADRSSLGSHKTLFDYLREDEKKWLWVAYPDGPGTTVGVLEQFNRRFSPDLDFFYLHFSELDWAGHQFGPHSHEQCKVLREIDEAVRKIYAKLNQSYEMVNGVIFGDHGQVRIKKNIDIESLLRESGLVLEKDYICFLDSTQARFWCFNDGARSRIVDLLSKIPDGTLLQETDYDRLHFRFADRRFGELIFVMNDETGIFPNYFQRQTAFKGLHGYLPEVKDNWAKLIITGCDVKRKLSEPVELVDLFPTLLELFGYRPPADSRLRSLFKSASIDRPTHHYKASVIMPTFNRLNVLQESVQAIEDQTAARDEFEFVVVDDGSEDGTVNFLADYQSKTTLNFHYLTQSHSGPAAARNLGITQSSGEITILLGDDMLAVPTLIADHLRFHREHSALSHSCVGFIDWAEGIEVNGLMRHVTSNQGGQQFNYADVESQDPDDVRWDAFWSGNLSFKKSLALTHGLFNAEVFKHALWEDIELGYRLQKVGLVLHFRKECKVSHKHVLTLDGFAERQRLVGWYTHELERLGVPVNAWRTDYGPKGYWSKKALKQTTEALYALERQSTDEAIPARLYNAWLNYATRVGYAERENVSQDEVEALIAHLHNLSLLEEENRRLCGQVEELQEQADRLQLFSDTVRRTFIYRVYRKFLRPFRDQGWVNRRLNGSEKADNPVLFSNRRLPMSKFDESQYHTSYAEIPSPTQRFAFRNDGRQALLKRLLALSGRAYWLWTRDGTRIFLRNVIQDLKRGYIARLLHRDYTFSSLSPKYRGTKSEGHWQDYFALSEMIEDTRKTKLAGFHPTPPPMVSFDEDQLAGHAAALQFPDVQNPEVSIIIPVFNKEKLTVECLASVARCTQDCLYEVIVIDDGSAQRTQEVLSRVRGLKYLQSKENLGFLRSCNRAAEEARGRFVVFLNNDVQVTPGWLSFLLRAFSEHRDVGAVGPKVLFPDGRLQEAGALIQRDASTQLIGLFDDPALQKYSTLREVDYLSGCCLMLPIMLFRQLDGFDEIFAPGYCEDVDLCMRIRNQGLRILYIPQSVVIHHLSATADALGPNYKQSLAIQHQQILSERWQTQIDALNKVRIIAFYLPQYHPIPENDLWWGKGFTEWTNVSKARPNFVGHYQPRLPADLGFYDLRLEEVIEEQAELAKRYGIHGFCFYYYWFNGKRLLELPIERLLTSNKPDIPFCLCWANENWTQRWDGGAGQILVEQRHHEDDDRAVILDLIRFMRHPNYIRINGRPLLVIYRIDLFPDIKRTAAIWRDVCHQEGVGDPYLAMVDSFDFAKQRKGSLLPDGLDASVDFPPHAMLTPIKPPGGLLNGKFNGAVYDYRETVMKCLERDRSDHVLFRAVTPSWDNTARRQNDPIICVNSSPGAYQAWLESAIELTRAQNFGDERTVFVVAWNEWAEGNYLEPDVQYGHGFLEATRDAQQRELLKPSGR